MVIGTHIDRGHIHSHIVFNSVNRITGEKYNSTLESYYSQIRAISDRLCREHGLSVIMRGDGEKAMSYIEWLRQSKGKPTYACLLRLTPRENDYNLYCYCYRRDWLDQHLKQAAKGIRFIDPGYEELFRIPDGDMIRITKRDGSHMDKVCRYIDEYHLEVGSDLYHICELAEAMERCGNTVIPLRSSLPERCYSVLPSSNEIIIVIKGESGCYRTDEHGHDRAEALAIVEERNRAGGVTKAQESAMLAGSMFSWRCPAADPKNYDEQGRPNKPKNIDRGDAR